MKETSGMLDLSDEMLNQVVGGDKTTDDGSYFSGYVKAKDAVQGCFYYAVNGQKWLYGKLTAKVSTLGNQYTLKFDVVETHGTKMNSVSGSTWFLFTTRS